jgi:hypothetical protein
MGAEELDVLRQIARWTRELALPIVKPRVERALDTDGKKRVYAALEPGTAGVVAIEKATGVNTKLINAWIKEWEVDGLVEKGASPARATFSLQELGIEPAPPKATRVSKAKP